MGTEKLFIPKRINVGYQKRGGTYTGNLAYVIYWDQKGVLRKESSWNNWRHTNIEPKAFDNIPTSGFVLNKKAGGGTRGWDARNTYVRVYDPRDFEIEITIPNLVFILQESDCSRGKGLEGNFVYAWDGPELVLLPEGSQEFKSSIQYTDLQSQGVKVKDLTPGATYTTKKLEDLLYIGKFDYFFIVRPDHYTYKASDAPGVATRFVFWTGSQFTTTKDIKTLGTIKSENKPPNYAELVDEYSKSAHGSKITELFLKSMDIEKKTGCRSPEWFVKESEGVFVSFSTESVYGGSVTKLLRDSKYFIKNGVFTEEDYDGWSSIDQQGLSVRQLDYYSNRQIQWIDWVAPTNKRLFAKLESGSEFRVSSGIFNKEW